MRREGQSLPLSHVGYRALGAAGPQEGSALGVNKAVGSCPVLAALQSSPAASPLQIEDGAFWGALGHLWCAETSHST